MLPPLPRERGDAIPDEYPDPGRPNMRSLRRGAGTSNDTELEKLEKRLQLRTPNTLRSAYTTLTQSLPLSGEASAHFVSLRAGRPGLRLRSLRRGAGAGLNEQGPEDGEARRDGKNGMGK